MEQQFTLQQRCLFAWTYGLLSQPVVISGKPTHIYDETMVFKFWYTEPQTCEVEKKHILAVDDADHGTVHIKGFVGTYRVLNESLFATYVKNKVIVLQ